LNDKLKFIGHWVKENSIGNETDHLAQLERLVMKAENVEKKLENRRRLIERWANK